MSLSTTPGMPIGPRSRRRLLLFLALVALVLYLFRGGNATDSTVPVVPPPERASTPLPGVIPSSDPSRSDPQFAHPSTSNPIATAIASPAAATPSTETTANGEVDASLNLSSADVVSYLGSPLPKSLTGRPLSRVYELAEKAHLADLAARQAYDDAIDSKALLFISAATSQKDLIQRYWQTHKLHYNASVQHAAAERLREFITYPNVALNSDSSSLLLPRKTPLCLISTYQGNNDAFPQYATVLADNIVNNAPYADLHIFIHNVTAESFPSGAQRDNVKWISLDHIDESYRYRGFPGFATDKLCKLFGRGTPRDKAFGWEGQDEMCASLETAMGQFERSNGNLMEELKGQWGNIFSDWISSDRCESWAWVDPGVAVGNLSRWMDNDLVRQSDILTAHEGDRWRLYLRNTFTVHNYRRNADAVNSLWKRCDTLASLENLLKAFRNPSNFLGLTEGCYSKGALTAPRIQTMLAPWQMPAWGEKAFVLLHEGRANYCLGEANAELCRGWVRGYMEERERAAATAKPGITHTASEVLSAPPQGQERTPLLDTRCADWIPAEYNLCIPQLDRTADWRTSIYVQLVRTDPTTNVTEAVMQEYETPADGVGADGVGDRGVGEALIVKYLAWASKTLSKGERAPPKLERTYWYSAEKGSVQITQGKILLHNVRGWW
ncbi:hypothetical protein HDU85_007561 [Gaertneriomyces sp. JEL0708]|nr:hypothetical protein HDU85_007561 [Gaertneriomyces sp. JEL0708]